jgi:hypothetical protein
MPFSPKAQEIYDHIVRSGKTAYWTDVARTVSEHRCQHRPGRHDSGDVHALRDRLQAELSYAVKNTHDHHWEEIAHWLVYEAKMS